MSVTNEKFLLTYPNLEDPQGDVVLENKHVVVQRLVVPTGKWEGVHSHPGNQLYVHILEANRPLGEKAANQAGRINGRDRSTPSVRSRVCREIDKKQHLTQTDCFCDESGIARCYRVVRDNPQATNRYQILSQHQ